MGWLRDGEDIDACIGRGCGGYLAGVGTTVGDGETARCFKCMREVTFHVAGDDEATALIRKTIEPKPRRKRHP